MAFSGVELPWNFSEVLQQFTQGITKDFLCSEKLFQVKHCMSATVLDATEHNFESYSNISVAQVFIDFLEREYIKKLKMQLKTFKECWFHVIFEHCMFRVH